MSVPQSTLTLYANIPFSNDYQNTKWHTNSTNQINYFNNFIDSSHTLNSYTYLRKGYRINLPYVVDNVNVNYCCITNNEYSSKRYYYFITDLQYENSGTTTIFIELDVIQTYMFDMSFKQSFVVREHVSDDTIGANTVEENLDLGKPIVNEFTDVGYNSSGSANALAIGMVVVGTSEPLQEGVAIPSQGKIGGILNPAYYYAFYTTDSELNTLNQLIIGMGDRGLSDAIFTMFMCPSAFITRSDTTYVITNSSYLTFDATVPKNYTLNGYTPRNNKLYTYPYNYCLASNQNGETNVYRYENFSGNNMPFRFQGIPVQNNPIKVFPRTYNGYSGSNLDETMTMGNFPSISWITDPYANWVAQSGTSTAIGLTTSIATAGVSALTGNVVGASISSANIIQHIAQIQERKIEPDSIKNQGGTGNINFALAINRVIFGHYSIKSEYARIIDEFFTMFGYKVNRVKVPNITGRANWNYVELINPNITGNIPNNDMETIKRIYSQGITHWHTSDMYNYSLSN